jgi:hypothetical protein
VDSTSLRVPMAAAMKRWSGRTDSGMRPTFSTRSTSVSVRANICSTMRS